MADHRGRFLYEIRPDIIPEGYMSRVELELWSLFYEQKNREWKASQRR